MRSRLSTILRTVLGVPLLLVAMALLHLPTAAGRAAVRDVANPILRGLFQGSVTVGHVAELSVFRGTARLTEVEARDPAGHPILEGVTIDAARLWSLLPALRQRPGATMPDFTLHARVLTLRAGSTIPVSVGETFFPRPSAGPPAPPSAAPPIFLSFPSLRVSVDTVVSELGGVHVVSQRLVASGSLQAPRDLRIDVPNVTLASIAPTPFTPALDARADYRWVSQLENQPDGTSRDRGTMRATADLRGVGLQCHVEFSLTDGVTRLRAHGCSVDTAVLERAAGTRLGIAATIDDATVTLAPNAPIVLEATAHANEQPVALRASLQSSGDLEASVTTTGLDPSRFGVAALPGDLRGRVVLRRVNGVFEVDARGLTGTLARVPVPGLRARGRFERGVIEVDDLEVESIGVHARARVPLAAPLESQVTLQVHRTRIEEIPGLPVPLAGELSGTVTLTTPGGVPTAHVDLHSPRFNVPNVRAEGLAVRGRVTLRDRVPHLDVAVSAQQVDAANQPPLRSVRAHVRGDPRQQLDGEADVDVSSMVARYVPRLNRSPNAPRDAPSTAALPFRVRLGSGGVGVEVQGGRVRTRGQQAVVAVRVQAPSGGDPRIDADVRLSTGLARASLSRGNLLLHFEQLEMSRVASVLGLPAIGGTLDGHVDLAALRRLGGTQSLRWTHGVAPVLGGFDLDLEARSNGEHLNLNLGLEYNGDTENPEAPRTAQSRLTARLVQPARLGDVSGWLHGARELHWSALRTPLHMVDSFLPSLLHAQGTVDFQLDAQRARADEVLQTVFGFDLRDGQLEATLRRGALGSILGNAVQNRPLLAEPLRLRGAVCAHLEGAAWQHVPVETRMYLAPEQEPRAHSDHLPRDCSTDETQVAEPLARVALSLEGTRERASPPWWHAVQALLRTLRAAPPSQFRWQELRFDETARRALADTHLDAEVVLGPLSPERWPFADAAGSALSVLARPTLQATATATVRAHGPALNPTVGARVEGAVADLAPFVSHDRIEGSLVAVLSRREEEPEDFFAPANLRVKGRLRLLGHEARGMIDSGSGFVDVGMRVEPRALLDGRPRPGHHLGSLESLLARTDAFELSRLRAARRLNLAGGLTLEVRETGNTTTPIRVAAHVDHLQLRSGNPLSVTTNAFVRNNLGMWEVQSCTAAAPDDVSPNCNPDAEVRAAPAGQLLAEVVLPLGCNLLRARPRLDRLLVDLAAQDFGLDPVSPLLEISPLVRVGGRLTADLEWNAQAPRAVNGTLSLAHGLVDIERVGIPLREIALDVRAAGRHIDIQQFTALLGEGSLEVRGATVDLERPARRRTPAADEDQDDGGAVLGLSDFDRCVEAERELASNAVVPDANSAPPEQPADGSGDSATDSTADDLIARIGARVRTRQLPVPREGTVLAMLTSSLDYSGEVRSSGHTGQLYIEALDVALPTQSSRTLQSLSPHPDVFIVGETRIARAPPASSFPIELDFRTGSRAGALGTINLRRDDFDIAVRIPDGEVILDDAGTALRFEIEDANHQSYYELLGKRFYVDRLGISQTHSTHLNPTLDLALHYDGNDTGRITVAVTGTLDEPSVNLAAEQLPGASQSDVLALLVLGRQSSRGASDQENVAQAALAMMSSVAFGVGTSALSRELRESRAVPFVPRIIAEPNFNGTPNDIGRYGAGASIGSNVYIEGTYGTAGSAAGGSLRPASTAGTEARVLLEVNVTEHISLVGYFGIGGGSGGNAVSGRGGAELFYQP